MVNWQDPALLLNEYFAFLKLNHAIIGIYIWETVFTVGFELDVLRGKRPYRWTIWLYLGTRYTCLLAYIFFLIDLDGPRLPCHPLMVIILALFFISWAFASFIIVLRIMAIWNRNIIVSLIAIGVWAGALSLHLRSLVILTVSYNAVVNTCVALHTHRGLVNAVGVLVVDVVLLLTMLIGLLRHSQKSSTGVWKLLYQQCIIWIALALLAEIPPVVFLILNLNDAWNEMFIGVAIFILSIGAARMYRSLSDRGSFTHYEPSDPPQFSSGASNPTVPSRGSNVVQVSSVTQSEGSRTICEAPVFLPANQILMDFVPDGSRSGLAHEYSKVNANPTGYGIV